MTRFDAADCAARILKRHGGNVKAAIQDAQYPFKIDGKFTY